MSNGKVVFIYEGVEHSIQCLKTDKAKNICQNIAMELNSNSYSLVFLFNGKLLNQLNQDLSFEELANKEKNEMKVLVYDATSISTILSKNGNKTEPKIKNIKELNISFNKIKDKIEEIKLKIDNIIKNSVINLINCQLKEVINELNIINEDIEKNNKVLDYLSKENNNKKLQDKNIIKAELDIKSNESNNIILFNADINKKIDVYLDDNKINMIKDNNQWKINYKFSNDGKYTFNIIFQDNITNMKDFFKNCSNLISVDLSNFNSSNVTDMGNLFNECNKLKEIKGINKLNTNKVTNMTGLFDNCHILEKLDLSNFNTENVQDMSYMFNNCRKLKEIKGINKLNTNKVIAMNTMFQACYELEYLDLSNFNTENVTNMSYMFNECNKLKEIKGINKFKNNKVTSMNTMFQKCYELVNLDLSNFNTENVTNMSYMFNQCYKLKEIKGINKFITNKVTNMKAMFQLCKEIENLDLSNFNTENVKEMSNMFKLCNKLQNLNLLNFSMNCERTKDMFLFQDRHKCNFVTNNKDLSNLFK